MRISASVGFGFSCRKPPGAGDHARRAEAALQAVMLAEHLLQHVQVVRRAQPLDRRDLAPSAWAAKIVQDFTDMPSKSTVQAPQWRGLAADMRPGEVQLLAQHVDQQARAARPGIRPRSPFTVIFRCILSTLSLLPSGARPGGRDGLGQHPPATWCLKSTGPRLSSTGSIAACIAAMAAFTASGPQVVPTSAAPAPATQTGVSERLVIATLAEAQVPPDLRQPTAAAAVA